MPDENIYPRLKIPKTMAAGPRTENRGVREIAVFSNASSVHHLSANGLKEMNKIENFCYHVEGTDKTYTFGIASNRWSALDIMFCGIQQCDIDVWLRNGILDKTSDRSIPGE